MELSGKDKRALRARGQMLDASVQVGKEGVTANVIKTLADQFGKRDLIKVKLTAEDRDALATQVASLATGSGSTMVSCVGKTAVLYRPLPNPK